MDHKSVLIVGGASAGMVRAVRMELDCIQLLEHFPPDLYEICTDSYPVLHVPYRVHTHEIHKVEGVRDHWHVAVHHSLSIEDGLQEIFSFYASPSDSPRTDTRARFVLVVGGPSAGMTYHISWDLSVLRLPESLPRSGYFYGNVCDPPPSFARARDYKIHELRGPGCSWYFAIHDSLSFDQGMNEIFSHYTNQYLVNQRK